jgi:hypothetical protein
VESSWGGPDRTDLVLHELMHALVGPDSLQEELVLMAVQWSYMRRLPEPERSEARDVFSTYYLSYKEIGPSDVFRRLPSWKKSVRSAINLGLLHRNGAPNLASPIPIADWHRKLGWVD